jgi:hypothetical protein
MTSWHQLCSLCTGGHFRDPHLHLPSTPKRPSASAPFTLRLVFLTKTTSTHFLSSSQTATPSFSIARSSHLSNAISTASSQPPSAHDFTTSAPLRLNDLSRFLRTTRPQAARRKRFPQQGKYRNHHRPSLRKGILSSATNIAPRQNLPQLPEAQLHTSLIVLTQLLQLS